MSLRIPAVFKAELGELLGAWYRNFGKVTPRRAYHEDEQTGGSGAGTAKPFFIEHPYLNEVPLGASSDLEAIITNDSQTLEETEKRSQELLPELQHKLDLELGQKNQFLYKQYMRLQS